MNILDEKRKALNEYLEMEANISGYGAFYDGYCTLLDDSIAALEAKGMPVVCFPAGDGHTWYAQIARDDDWAIFVWLTGGPDNWDLPIGDVFAVPVSCADALIEREKAFAELFGPKGDET